MLNDHTVNHGIALISAAATKAFAGDQTRRNIEQQQAVFDREEDITNVLSAQQEKDRDEGEPFTPDVKTARSQAEHTLSWGVSARLKSAYSLYKAGDELECIRCILIALCVVTHALGWKKATAYLNAQDTILYNFKQKEHAEDSAEVQASERVSFWLSNRD